MRFPIPLSVCGIYAGEATGRVRPREPRGARPRGACRTGRAQAVLRLTLSAVYVGLTAAARQTRLDPDGTRPAVARDAARDDAG